MEGTLKNWYRCEKHKVIFSAMSPADARLGTGRAPQHCGFPKTFWISEQSVEDWKAKGYKED